MELKLLMERTNKLRLVGITHILMGLKENISLISLDLSWNGIEIAHGKDLGSALMANSTLRELNLNNNRLCRTCATFIAKAITTNESLSCLRINGNSLGEDGFRDILQAIISNQRPARSQLEYHLDFPKKEILALLEEVREKFSFDSVLSFRLL